MKLLNDFYEILNTSDSEQSITFRIRFRQEHIIYQAHFPGNPITPGACLAQIAKELLETHSKQPLRLRKIVNLKFLKTIEARKTAEVSLIYSKIEENAVGWDVTVNIVDGEDTYTKMHLQFDKIPSVSQRMEEAKVCLIIPSYNSGSLLADVLKDFSICMPHIVIVDDGSTDCTMQLLSQYKDVHLVHYDVNHGKGYALNKGFDCAAELGYDYAITVDADTQHKACDVTAFLDAVHRYPDSLIVGNRHIDSLPLSRGARFANLFSNFWFAVQTGIRLPDTQTGYRCYPLRKMKRLRSLTSRYEAEVELMVRIAWKGIDIHSVPVNVFYPSSDERLSHFRPTIDFIRISLLNSILVIFAVIYGYPSRLICKLRH